MRWEIKGDNLLCHEFILYVLHAKEELNTDFKN